MNFNNANSAQPCGCDPGAGYQCLVHEAHIIHAEYVVKDSGKRQQFAGGMVRDVEANKPDYSLILDGPMFDRWAEHLTKGAIKYSARNWMKAEGVEEYERFRRSAFRHLRQWLRGDNDEDHASAVYFNINGAEFVKGRL